MSKALAKSNKIMSTCDPFAKRLTISCTVMTSCDSQDRLYLKPCCASDKMLLASKCLTVLMLGYGYLDCLPCLSLGFLVRVTLMLLFLSLLLSIHYYSSIINDFCYIIISIIAIDYAARKSALIGNTVICICIVFVFG